ncbi:hypothetical protein HNR17_002056 [Galbitalea soli]|nr:hypothetical protein [Galbitalea soli]
MLRIRWRTSSALGNRIPSKRRVRRGVVSLCALLAALSGCAAQPRAPHSSTSAPLTAAQRDQALLQDAARVIKADNAASDRVFAGVEDVRVLRRYESDSWFAVTIKGLQGFRASAVVQRGQTTIGNVTFVSASIPTHGTRSVIVGYCADVSGVQVVNKRGNDISSSTGAARQPLLAKVLVPTSRGSLARIDSVDSSIAVDYC